MIYEIQQSSDSCPQCSRNMRRRSNSYSSSSQSEQPKRIIIPLKKNVLQQNQNIEAALNLLHQQVEQLKQQNKEKQKQIKDLEMKLVQKVSRTQFNCTNQSFYDQSKVDRKLRRYLSPEEKSMRSDYFQIPKANLKKNGSSKTLDQVNYIENKIQQINEYKNERIRMLENQIEQYQRICQELKTRIAYENQNIEWMSQFCLSFCNMANKISKMQGQIVTRQNWTLRQNTKNSWKFFKTFVKEVME